MWISKFSLQPTSFSKNVLLSCEWCYHIFKPNYDDDDADDADDDDDDDADDDDDDADYDDDDDDDDDDVMVTLAPRFSSHSFISSVSCFILHPTRR